MSNGRYTNLIECTADDPARAYLAHDTVLHRDVELKLLPADANGHDIEGEFDLERVTEPALVRFFHEARAVSKLEHPAIPPVLDAGRWPEGGCYYTLRLARGESLRKRIESESKRARRLRYLPHFVTAARAIAYSHSRGVIHRGLNPEAIVVGPYGDVSVEHWSRAGIVNGVPSPELEPADQDSAFTYIAPELRHGGTGDSRSDVYGLGAVLYFIVMGQDPPANIDSVPASQLSGPLGQACRRAMALDPGARYESVEDLMLAVAPLAGGAADESSPVSAERQRLRRARRAKRWTRTGLLAALLCAIIAGTVYSLVPKGDDWAVPTADGGLSRADRLALADATIRTALDPEQPLREQHDSLLYWAGIASAGRDIQQGKYAEASAALFDTAAPRRHWEWGYLQHELNRDRLTIQASDEALFALAYAPDGSAVAVSGRDPIVREYSTTSGRPIRTYDGHRADVRAIAIAPGGGTILTAGWDGLAIVWLRETGQPFVRYQGHDNAIWAAAYAADGSWIATAGEDRGIHAWDPRSGQGVDRLWNPETGQPSTELRGHRARIAALAFSDDGRYLVSGDLNGVIRVNDLQERRTTLTLEAADGAYVTGLDVHPGNRVLLAGLNEEGAKTFSLTTGEALASFGEDAGAVHSAAFGDDGKRVITGLRGGTVRIYDTLTGRLLAHMGGQSGDITDARTSAGTTDVASISTTGHVRIWPVDRWIDGDGRPRRTHASPSAGIVTLAGEGARFTAVAIHPGGEFAATGGRGREVMLWDLETGEAVDSLRARGRRVAALAYNRDGSRLAVGWERGTVDVWDLASRTVVRSLRNRREGVARLVFSDTGANLAIGHEDGAVAIWDLDANAQDYFFQAHPSASEALDFHPMEQSLATGGSDDLIRIWHEDSPNAAIHTLSGHTRGVRSVAFSPGGDYLVSASYDGTARLWDAEQGRYVRTVATHTGPLLDAEFTQDGQRIVATGEDGTVRVYDIAAGREILTLNADGLQAVTARVGRGGRAILAADRNGAVYTWTAFPWDPARYPGDDNLLLSERVERYKRMRFAEPE